MNWRVWIAACLREHVDESRGDGSSGDGSQVDRSRGDGSRGAVFRLHIFLLGTASDYLFRRCFQTTYFFVGHGK